MVMLHHRDNARFKFEGDTSNSLGDISICLIYFNLKLSRGIFCVSLMRWPFNEFVKVIFSRVLRDSTPRSVGPSVRRSVGPSVHPSVTL